MPEYIERKELINAIKRLKHFLNTGLARHNLTQKDIMRLIETQPAADVAPVVHGRWEEQYIYICNSDDEPVSCIGREYKCSECGRTEPKRESYCNCGAKMDLKEETIHDN